MEQHAAEPDLNLTQPCNEQKTTQEELAIEIATCRRDGLHVFHVVFSMELTLSAKRFFTFHPDFEPVSKECLLCGGTCDVRVLLPGTKEHADIQRLGPSRERIIQLNALYESLWKRPLSSTSINDWDKKLLGPSYEQIIQLHAMWNRHLVTTAEPSESKPLDVLDLLDLL